MKVIFIVLFAMALSGSSTAQTGPSQYPPECKDRPGSESMADCVKRVSTLSVAHSDQKEAKTETKSDDLQKAETKSVDQRFHEYLIRNNCKLPSARDAYLDAQRAGKSAAESNKAYDDALEAEVKGAETNTCITEEGTRVFQASVQAKATNEEGKRNKEIAERDEAKRKSEIALHNCDIVKVGTSEDCVHTLMGYPDHTNRDLYRGGESLQLVYPNDTYIYIVNGYVSGIQTRD